MTAAEETAEGTTADATVDSTTCCIVEGVENAAQAQALRRTGCRYAQGTLYSPPVPREAVADLLAGQLASPPR